MDVDPKKPHPELREGEIFLGNVIPGGDYREGWQFQELDSFRLGNVAYDMFGKERLRLRPAFAKAEEFYKKEKGRKGIAL